MDRFDETIKNSKKTYTPSAHFVDRTMSRIAANQKHRGWGFKLWVPALTGAAALFLIIFLSVPAPNHKAAPTKGAPAQTTTQPSQPGTGAGQPDTTSNLDSQLNGVGSAINQENADQANANTALNDSQYEIAVPTN